jgi:hypothetical protein
MQHSQTTFIILNKGEFLIGTGILNMGENLEELEGLNTECYRNLFPTCLKIQNMNIP